MNTYYRRLGPLEDAPSNAIRVKRVDVELPVVFTLVPADIENTPDSASTGMDFAEQIAERICDLVVPAVRREQAFPMPELVIILQEAFVHVRRDKPAPSGGGEWTRGFVRSLITHDLSNYDLDQLCSFHNAALRENNEKWRKEVKQFIERQHSLRDCGNDTKRLDLMETQGGQFAKIKGKSWRESADIHAAMSQTKERK